MDISYTGLAFWDMPACQCTCVCCCAYIKFIEVDHIETDDAQACLQELITRANAGRYASPHPILVEVRLTEEYVNGGAYSFGLGARSDEGWRPFEMD